jgi:hypothetical protein
MPGVRPHQELGRVCIPTVDLELHADDGAAPPGADRATRLPRCSIETERRERDAEGFLELEVHLVDPEIEGRVLAEQAGIAEHALHGVVRPVDTPLHDEAGLAERDHENGLLVGSIPPSISIGSSGYALQAGG